MDRQNDEGLATTTCRMCGAEIRFTRAPTPFDRIEPTVCDPCAEGVYEKERQQKAAQQAAERLAELSRLPYRHWSKELGNNELLAKVLAATITKAGVATNQSLYVFGPTGTGKTRSVCEAARRRSAANGTWRFVSASDASDGYRIALSDSTLAASEYKKRLCSSRGALIIDDIGVGKESERSSELWLAVADARLTLGVPTWWTSNLSLDDIAERFGEEYGPRIARRIAETSVGIYSGTAA